MFEKIFLAGYFDYKKFILDNSKVLGLTPNDALILIYLIDNYFKNIKIIDVDNLVNTLNLHKNEINNSLTNLLENSFYNVSLVSGTNGLEEQISFIPLLKKIEDFYKDEELDDTNKKIFTLIERKSKKILSASDYDNINNLIVLDKYDYNDFNETISYLEKAKLDVTVRNIIKYIEKKQVKEEETINPAIQELMAFFRKQNG